MKNKLQLLFTIIFYFLLIFEASSQTIAVKSFRKLETDQEARIVSPKTDQNGKKCAIIKVVTSQTGFAFDFGMIGNAIATEQKLGEIWVWVPAGARKVTINHQHLGVLRDYPFEIDISEATVYEMVLTTGKVEISVKEDQIALQWLVINSTPTGADLYVDDQAVNQTPYQRELPLGKHSYRLSHDMYLPTAGSILLKPDQKEVINSVLKPDFGKLNILTSPENGAAVSIDGQPTGKITPCTLEQVKSGEHTVTLRLNMYKTASEKITMQAGGDLKLPITLSPTFSEVTINTNPASDIYIAGELKGNGKWIGRLLPGFYLFEARKDKYNSVSEKHEAITGQALNLTFQPIAKNGMLKIITTPNDATILLDGVSRGTTPATIRNLLVGDYSLTLSLPNYATINKTIAITEGQTTQMNETLVNEKSININSEPTGNKKNNKGNPITVDLKSHSQKGDIKDIIEIENDKNSSMTDDQKLLHYRKMIKAATNDQEKILIIKSMGQVKTFMSLVSASSFLEDSNLKTIAAKSVMDIALPSEGHNGLSGIVVREYLTKSLSNLSGNENNYNRIRIQEYLAEMSDESGFVPIFNGKDLKGWQGLVKNPVVRAKMSKEELAKSQIEANAKILNNWLIKDGCIVFSGEGDNLCTERMYTDFEMMVDWKITKDGDSGIYLRGSPQVQIWDTSRVDVGAQVGSGGLYNNHKNPSKPLMLADNAIGDWNTFRIKMIGERVTVYLNGILVVDNVVMENYWERSMPIFPRGSIELQAHGKDLAFRDIYIKELNSK